MLVYKNKDTKYWSSSAGQAASLENIYSDDWDRTFIHSLDKVVLVKALHSEVYYFKIIHF